MKVNTFDIGDVFSKAWKKTQEHAWFLFLSGVGYVVVLSFFRHFPPLRYIMQTFVNLSASSLILAIVHDKKPHIHDLTKHFATHHKPLRILILSIIITLITTLGLILFIIPGLYIALRFMFYPYYVIEHEHKTIKESLGEIWAITEGHTWDLFVFCVVAVCVNILGFLALGIGLLVTIPITFIATGYIYKTLTPHYRRNY